MSEQEPVTFGKPRLLRVETLDQSHERASTGISSQDRWCKLAAEWVFGAVLNGASKETAVKIKDSWRGT